MPKIFIIERSRWTTGDSVCGALAEDGTPLGGHVSSSLSWARIDMGLTSDVKHDVYRAHYPDGYELVDLLDVSDRLADFPDYMAALERNRAKYAATPAPTPEPSPCA